jgi:hypothetical protein
MRVRARTERSTALNNMIDIEQEECSIVEWMNVEGPAKKWLNEKKKKLLTTGQVKRRWMD